MVPNEYEPVEVFLTARCTVSDDAPVAAVISSAIILIDCVWTITTNCGLNVVWVASVYIMHPN